MLVGLYGTLTVHADGSYSYAPNATAINALTAPTTDLFNVQVSDGIAAAVTTLTVNITGANDAPVISADAADLQGSVTEDGWPVASGHLDASDVDFGDTLRWFVVGGDGTNADYFFSLDEFQISKNGQPLFFDDTFSDGNAPPSSPTSLLYGVNGGPGTLIEVDGRVVMYGPNGPAPAPGVTGSPLFVTEGATLLTDRSAGSALGLRLDSTFTVTGRFDFVIPEDLREGYGIRLTDRFDSSTGADTLELVVRRDVDGYWAIQFRDLNFVTNTVTPLGEVVIADPTAGDQIVLRLSHDTSGSQDITASFDIYNANGNFVSTTALPGTGQIFTLPGEDWTRAQFVGYEPVEDISIFHGTYGYLTIDQDGNWQYVLADSQSNVQALYAGQHVTDEFDVRVADLSGLVDTRHIVIDVTGSNDAPVLSSAAAPVGAVVLEDAGAPGVGSGTLISALVDLNPPPGGNDNVTDADAGAVTGIAITAADAANGTWFYSLDGGANWTALGTPSDSRPRLLAADADNRIYFRPNANYDGSADITFRAWDTTSGTDGGTANTTTNGTTTAFSTATDTATFDVTPVNDAPVLNSAAAPVGAVVLEDAGAPGVGSGTLCRRSSTSTRPPGASTT